MIDFPFPGLAIHPAYQRQFNRLRWLVLAVLLVTLLAWLMPLAHWLVPFSVFLPLHALVEIIAVVVAFMIFAVGWSAWRRDGRCDALILALSFLGVGLLDISHLLTFEGMMPVAGIDGVQVTLQYWLAARLLGGLGLLAMLLAPRRCNGSLLSAAAIGFPVLLYVLLVHWLVLLTDFLPPAFDAGEGLTFYKRAFEWVLVGVHLLVAVLLSLQLREEQAFNVPALWAAALILAITGVLFAVYQSLNDLYVLLGHGFKVMAFVLLYRALFVETVELPYRRAKESERTLEKLLAEQRLASVAFDTQVAIMVTDADQRILRVNRTFSDITGYSSEEVIGENPRILSSGLQSKSFYREMWAILSREGRWEGEIWNRRKNGQSYPEHLVISVVKNDAGQVEYYVANFSDLTSAKQAEERIHSLAYFDPLTRLGNRRLLVDHIRKARSEHRDTHRHWALLFIDLDDFKSLNDARGHTMGDVLLQRAAERLTSSTREEDIVARPGGDEFAVLLTGLSADRERAAEAIQDVAAKLLEQLQQPYYVNEGTHHVGASIGIALYGSEKSDADELLGRAELAMYQAKSTGGGDWCFFDPEMQQQAQQRSRLTEELREALERDQLELYYQPKVDINAQVVGFEGLLRWHHPVRGLVPPGDFIPLAEQSGLILPLGRWVIEGACRQLREWATNESRRHWTIAVNISGRQLSHIGFPAEVKQILHEHGICPPGVEPGPDFPVASGRLEFEVTESMLLEDLQGTVATINELSALGINFAMDDFGTGYSSLSYLKMLPLQTVKVDRSFVRDMLVDRGDAAIVEMVIALAKTLDFDVVAEGVEELAQHRALVDLGCDLMQGYYYGRPVPGSEIELQLQQLPELM